MELYDFKIKKFLIFPEMKPSTISAHARQIKKSTSRKFLIFQEKETQKNLYFLKRRLLLYFRKRKPQNLQLVEPENQSTNLLYAVSTTPLAILFSATGILITYPIVDI